MLMNNLFNFSHVKTSGGQNDDFTIRINHFGHAQKNIVSNLCLYFESITGRNFVNRKKGKA